MKFVLLLCILSVILLQAHASPVNVAGQQRQQRAVARQQAVGANDVAPAATPDDDDDDDDEDDDDFEEPDLGDLIDDDDDEEDDDDDDEEDDDEEEDDTPQGQAAPASTATNAAATDDDEDDDEEDDDDDDYLDRLFDDILGDEEDDDDEEDDVVRPVAAAQSPVASAPASIDDIAPVGQTAVQSGISDGVDLPNDSAAASSIEPIGSGNAADELAAAASSGNAVQSEQGVNGNNEGGITGGEDDDEETDDDDDDDDDDIIGDDVIEARREARDLKNNIIDMSNDAFQERHNHFIDAIFARINNIVSDNYDPFVMRLNERAAVKKANPTLTAGTTPRTTTTATKKHTTKGHSTGNTTTHKKKLKNTKSEPRADSATGRGHTKLQQQMQQLQMQDKLRAGEQLKDVASSDVAVASAPAVVAASEMAEKRTVFDNDTAPKSSASSSAKKTANKTHKQQLKKGTTTSTSTGSTSGHNSNSNKQHKLKHQAGNGGDGVADGVSGKDIERLQKAEGSLSGLASLKRVGNVKVVSDPEGRNSTIKAKFTLGPLILRVEKSFKRGNVQSVKSATARTNEMIGRIKFSVVNDRATLMSIKVQQPKQVEVESKDNHDRTREFVWRRTPKIAKLVNEKLKLAAESIFTPQGVEVVRL